MIYVIVALGVLVLLLLVLVRIDTDDEDLAEGIKAIRAKEEQRKRRLVLLNKAYVLAKEELGEEPTIEQILLTRDTLKDDDGPTR